MESEEVAKLEKEKENLHKVIEACGNEIDALRKICDDLYYGRTGAFGRLEDGMFAYEEKFLNGS